jgi:hypothetical protein
VEVNTKMKRSSYVTGNSLPGSTTGLDDNRHMTGSANSGATYRRGILEFSPEGATMTMTERDFVRDRRTGE